MSANQPPENDTPKPEGTPHAGDASPAAPPFAPAGQPQQPFAGGYPPAAGAFVPQAPPAPKRSGVAKRILFSVVGAIVAIVVGILVRNGIFDSPSMTAGDCVQQTGEDSVKVVACDSADAQYSVLGIVEKQSQISARMGACKAFPETTSVYWQGRDTKSGTVYCLKKL